MKRTKKRVVSMLLSMTMVMALFAVMPMTALAAGPDVAGTCELYDDSNNKVGTTHSFNDALSKAVVINNYTIRLLSNIEVLDYIDIYNDIILIIDLNGYTLDITNSSVFGSALYLSNTSLLTIKGPGTLNATGGGLGVGLSGSSKLLINNGAVINAKATRPYGEAVSALAGSSATVSSANATGHGVTASMDSSVTVTGNVTVTDGHGISVSGTGSSITVNGNVSATETGVYAEGGGSVTVGSVTKSGDGVFVTSEDSSVTVTGNVNATGTGVYVEDGGSATVGSVTASGDGVYVTDASSSIKVNGNVVSEKNGAHAEAGGKVTIDGTITVPGGRTYI